jgi:hypothetical protein
MVRMSTNRCTPYPFSNFTNSSRVRLEWPTVKNPIEGFADFSPLAGKSFFDCTIYTLPLDFSGLTP